MFGAFSTRSDCPSVGLIRPAIGGIPVGLSPDCLCGAFGSNSRLSNDFARRSPESPIRTMPTILPSKHPGQRPSTTS